MKQNQNIKTINIEWREYEAKDNRVIYFLKFTKANQEIYIDDLQKDEYFKELFNHIKDLNSTHKDKESEEVNSNYQAPIQTQVQTSIPLSFDFSSQNM